MYNNKKNKSTEGFGKKMQEKNYLCNYYYDFMIASKCSIILNDLIPFI
jgi:hypothetical protein